MCMITATPDAPKNLTALYCYYCDQNYDADRIAACLVEDGIWDEGQLRRI